MKILHVVEDYSMESGGLRTVIKNLDLNLKVLGIDNYIITSKKEKEDNVKIVQSNNIWMYNRKWKKEILKIIEEFNIDIVHIHGVWMYPQFIAAKICKKNKIDFVLSPHGMYEPWLWKKGGLKKKIYFNFLAKHFFSKAKYIHGITSNEIDNLKNLFSKNKFIEIPNLISIRKEKTTPKFKDKYVLYLGRLDGKKGIDTLLKAFAKISNTGFKLKIAGSFNSYKIILDQIIFDLNIGKQVEFLGLIKDEEKTDIIKKAWVLVSPSHSEVIGMVNLESAAFKTPVITTYQTGIKKEWNSNGGILINPKEEDLIIALKEVMDWSEEERKKRGELLFNFVNKEYSWSGKLTEWKQLYKAVLK